MKKILTILSFVIAMPLFTVAQGTLVEDTIIMHLDFDDIDALFIQNGLPLGFLATNFQVDVHRVVYDTPDVDGTPTTASGLIFIPTGDTCAMPMMAYLHGTKVKKDDTFYYLNGEWFLGVVNASSGYVTCMPDYLGLGMSPGIHPYQHTGSQETASVDILRSGRMICQQEQRQLNGQLFLVGYSQGGHATLGTHRMIQEELSDEFTVTASAPGSGPYDISGSQLDMVAALEPYAQPGYLPYLIQSYQHVYGNLYNTLQDIYVSPYDVTLPPLLDGSATMAQLNDAMPAIPREIFQPAYADAFFADPLHPAFVALKDNDVYEWVPEAPVMFNYCRNDEEVTYLNTIVASEYMIAEGATDIQVMERDTVVGHFECAQPSILFSKLWFDTMAELCTVYVGVNDDPSEKETVSIFPNPVSDGVVHFSNHSEITVRVSDIQGREIIAQQIISPNGSLDITGINPGILLITVQEGESVLTRRLIVH